MRLTCDCCGHEEFFSDPEEAFQAGWDAPPHFTGYIACNLCPAAYLVLGTPEKHTLIHEQWKANGRPKEYSQETCILPEERVSEEALSKVEEFAKAVVAKDTDRAIRLMEELRSMKP